MKRRKEVAAAAAWVGGKRAWQQHIRSVVIVWSEKKRKQSEGCDRSRPIRKTSSAGQPVLNSDILT